MAQDEEPGVRPTIRPGQPDSVEAERDHWRAMYLNALTALAMIRETVESFGPVASLESEEATLALRGPEPIPEAEAIVEAPIRVKAAMAERKA